MLRDLAHLLLELLTLVLHRHDRLQHVIHRRLCHAPPARTNASSQTSAESTLGVAVPQHWRALGRSTADPSEADRGDVKTGLNKFWSRRLFEIRNGACDGHGWADCARERPQS